MKIKYTIFGGIVIPFLCLFATACATTENVDTGYKEAPQNQPHISAQTTGQLPVKPENVQLGLLGVLLGEWKIQDWQLRKDGQWAELNGAVWTFNAIQNGHALQDSWASYADDRTTVAGHVNAIRHFNHENSTWQAAWLSSNSARLEVFDGEDTGSEVVFISKEATKGRLSRHVFSHISPQRFQWHIEWSKDGGETWLPVYRALATRP